VQVSGTPCRREVQPGGTRLPTHYGCGKAGPAEEDAGSEVLEWERREREEERRAEAEELGTGDELPLFLPTPSFVASVRIKGVRR